MKRLGILLIFILLSHVRAQEVRTWTSASGKTMEASFVERKFDQVILQLPGGEKMKIRLNQLSSADQIYVGSQGRSPPQRGKARASGDRQSTSSKLLELFGPQLVNARGEPIPTGQLTQKKKIGIYFSASWCGPCRQFTPLLIETYRQLQSQGKSFEVVLVSRDKDEEGMMAYMKSPAMPWLAVPFGDPRIKELVEIYGAHGIPKLVVVDANGKTLSMGARGEITQKGAQAFGDW